MNCRAIKFSEIMDDAFSLAFAQLRAIGADRISMKTALEIVRMKEVIEKHQKHFRELYVSLLRKHCKRDEKGGFAKTFDGKEYDVEDKKAWDKDYQELADLEIVVPTLAIEDLCVRDGRDKTCPISLPCLEILCKTVLSFA
jgi:hypothetical protein